MKAFFLNNAVVKVYFMIWIRLWCCLSIAVFFFAGLWKKNCEYFTYFLTLQDHKNELVKSVNGSILPSSRVC